MLNAPHPPSAPAVVEARRADLAVRDLTDPAAGPHAVQLVLDEAVAALRALWGCTARTHRSHPVVTVEDNYDRLHYSADAVAREARYTRYLSPTHVLRAHTSAMVPDALSRLGGGPVDDELVVCPGIVYRRDAIDRLHTGTPHQVDLWRVTRRPMTSRHLESMIRAVVTAVLPGRRWRTEPRTHSYTLEGRQVDVLVGDEWIEIGEGGLALPEILAEAGLDPRHHGLALGLGLDRLVQVRKGIDDIRLLRDDDPHVAAQMLDLEPYRAVSKLPAVVRDLSIAVEVEDEVEDLGDHVRAALGVHAESVESVSVVSETPWNELPVAARERLGMAPHQKNVLVRVVLRHLQRTLTDDEANRVHDRVYATLHRGRAP